MYCRDSSRSTEIVNVVKSNNEKIMDYNFYYMYNASETVTEVYKREYVIYVEP